MLKRYVKDLSGAFFIRLFSGVTLVTISLINAEVLGVTNFGRFVVLLVYSDLIATLSTLGFPTYFLREFAKAKEKEKLNGLFVLALLVTIICCGILSAIFSIFTPDIGGAPAFVFLYSLLQAWSLIFSSVLRAFGHFLEVIVYEALFKNILVLATIVYIWFASEPNIYNIYIAYLAPNSAFFIILTWRIANKRLFSSYSVSIPLFYYSLKKDVLPFAGGDVFQILTSRSYYIILNAFSLYDVIGIFRLCMSSSQLVTYVQSTVSMYFSPALAKDLAGENRTKHESKIIKVNLISFFVSLPLAVGLLLIFHLLAMYGWFNIDFSAVMNLLGILLVPIVLGNLFALNGSALQMMNKASSILVVFAINAAIHYLAGPILIGYFSLAGLAALFILNYVFINVCFNYLLLRCGINLYRFAPVLRSLRERGFSAGLSD